MYRPPSFEQTDRKLLFDFMERNPFATLVSRQADEELASHLPLLIDRDAGLQGRISGHFARANPHWQVAANQRVLVIFHGPHAYISPGWMDTRNLVPTWNYVAVHAYGTLRLVDTRQELHALVRRMVDHYESGRTPPWSLDVLEADFLDRLLTAIVGFEIDIERLEGKWKLSQNHPDERQEQIVRGLLSTGRSGDREVAEAMRVGIDSRS